MRPLTRLAIAALALPSAHHTLVAACRYYGALKSYRALDGARIAYALSVEAPMADPVDRQADYDKAESIVLLLAERWTEARAAQRMTAALDHEMNFALDEMFRAKRWLERTQRRSG